ncbi:hypothetical protein UlMin_034719 [Ulmus minor]
MVWPIRSKARWIIPSLEALGSSSSSVCKNPFHSSTFSGLINSFLGFPRKCPSSHPRTDQTCLENIQKTHLRLLSSLKRNQALRFEDSKDRREFEEGNESDGVDFFDDMRQRFLFFKKHKYLEELDHYRSLAEEQTPKFMVIACADSRVCPSNILGFQPGEAFMIRNVANLVPPVENGPSETNAALEFAVNTLQVENILVIGHSRCGGIETLMSTQNYLNTSFIHNWIIKAKAAKLRTKDSALQHSFDQQCRHCEKESINISLVNLLTYPWIEERVKMKKLSIHGGYYDFLNCSFEKWSLDIESIIADEGGKYMVKDQAYWS